MILNSQIVGFTIGTLLVIIGITSLVPAAVDWQADHDNFSAFLKCSIISLFFGGLLILSNQNYKTSMSVKETFLLTTLSWFSISLFSALPLYFSDLDISFTDAFFEAISGITTTGSTVLSGLDKMSPGILIWRSIIQWIGGIGIVAFAIVILPFLKIGGMQLFQTESSDHSEKVMPKTNDQIKSLITVYIALTVWCILTYYALGMSMFDAINHALTTIPTGGYSTHDASFGFFQNPAIHYAGAFFMLAGGLPFVLYIKVLFNGKWDFLKDEQFTTLMLMLTAFTLILTIWLYFNQDYSLAQSFQHTLFNIISIITTTGFATTDYTLWGSFAVTFFLFLTFLGACAGSTSGGIKVMRLVIAAKILKRQIKTLIYPHGSFALHYQGKLINTSVVLTVMGFLGLYVFCNVVLTIALSLLGLDFETALSGAATAIANVGPGVGSIIGPAGNFSSLPDAAKWLLCAGMLIGRLEIMTVLVLFRYEYWKS